MNTGLPLTLWFTTLWHLCRLLVVTTAVLVTVIAFAASVKPLADGKLDPADALKFMLLAIPPMLAYALPFAGGFAATLTYHRLATDNELVAAQASGVSLRSLLAPALAVGLSLGVALEALNEQVIPRFLRSMERLVTRDAVRMLTGSISKGRALQLNEMTLFADRVERVPPDPRSGAREQLVLYKLAIIETDSKGAVTSEATARLASVFVYTDWRPEGDGDRGEPLSFLRIWMPHVVAIQQGTLVRSEGVTLSVQVTNALGDNPKYLTWGRLRALRTHPENMDWIDARRATLAYRLAEEELLRNLDDSLRGGGRFAALHPDGSAIEVRAAGLGGPRDDGALPLLARADGSIEVLSTRGGESARRYLTEHATLATDIGPTRHERRLRLKLTLENARVHGEAADSAGPVLPRVQLNGLEVEPNPADALVPLAPAELLAIAASPAAGPVARAAARELSDAIDDLQREVTSKQQERLALAAAACVMVLTGAVTAVRLSGRSPLTVYLWSFFPALGSIMTIAGGQSMTHHSGPHGLLLLWGGVGALAAYTVAVYLRLARH